MKELEGLIFIWAEIIIDGGYWAFQDKKYIYPPNSDYPSYERWSYKGLHVLENGDRLTIYSKTSDEVFWTGEIKFKPQPFFKKSMCDFWIHNTPEGVELEKWIKWFRNNHPAKLVKKTT